MNNLPLRILSQGNKNGTFDAWFFDGINQIGEKVSGNTREEAIQNLTKGSK
jgi:hypothetical protein